MASKIGVITLDGPTYIVELASAISMTAGGSVRLKNLGPALVWLNEVFASDSSQSAPGAANAWPLSVGEEVTVTLPAYPVAMDTRVPGAVTDDAVVTRLAYIAEGF